MRDSEMIDEKLCNSCLHCKISSQEAPLFCSEEMEKEHAHIYCTIRKAFTHPTESCKDYKSRVEYEEEQRKKKLTHEGLKELCREFLKEKKWSPFEHLTDIKHEHNLHSRPDILAWKNDKIIALEVKPAKTSRDELRRGIGQCAWYLLHNYMPYLVASESYREELMLVFTKLGGPIGLILYDDTGKLSLILGKPL